MTLSIAIDGDRVWINNKNGRRYCVLAVADDRSDVGVVHDKSEYTPTHVVYVGEIPPLRGNTQFVGWDTEHVYTREINEFIEKFVPNSSIERAFFDAQKLFQARRASIKPVAPTENTRGNDAIRHIRTPLFDVEIDTNTTPDGDALGDAE